MKSGIQDIWTLRESTDLIGKYAQLQASVTSPLEIALDTVLKQNVTLACNMLLARRDNLLKDCSSTLGPKDQQIWWISRPGYHYSSLTGRHY